MTGERLRCFVAHVTVVAKQGYAQRAICLAGAEQALREKIGNIMSESRRRDYENALAYERGI
jgi:hypothetical protein